jgi:hypothetical protein
MTSPWRRCPRCNSAKVKRELDANVVGAMILLGIVCLVFNKLWIGFAFIGVGFIALAILGGAIKRNALQCQDCNHTFPREEPPAA